MLHKGGGGGLKSWLVREHSFVWGLCQEAAAKRGGRTMDKWEGTGGVGKKKYPVASSGVPSLESTKSISTEALAVKPRRPIQHFCVEKKIQQRRNTRTEGLRMCGDGGLLQQHEGWQMVPPPRAVCADGEPHCDSLSQLHLWCNTTALRVRKTPNARQGHTSR